MHIEKKASAQIINKQIIPEVLKQVLVTEKEGKSPNLLSE